MEFEDWLNWKLTGRKTVSMSVAAFRWNYDDKNGGYPVDFYNAVGLDDVVDKFPEPVLKVGEVVGNISAEAAEIFGLSKKTVVVEGTADCNACMFGVGGVRPNRYDINWWNIYLSVRSFRRRIPCRRCKWNISKLYV